MSSEEESYTVEKILKDKVERGKRLYLIKWKGYSKAHNSWEEEANIIDKSVIDDYINATAAKKRARSRTPGSKSRPKGEAPAKKPRTASRGRVTPAKRSTNKRPSTRAKKKVKEQTTTEPRSETDIDESSDNDSVSNYTRSAVKRRTTANTASTKRTSQQRGSSRADTSRRGISASKKAGKIEIVKRNRRVELPSMTPTKSSTASKAAPITAPKIAPSPQIAAAESKPESAPASDLMLLRGDVAQPLSLYVLITTVAFLVTAINCSPFMKQWVGSFSPLVSSKDSDPLVVVFLGNSIIYFVGFLSVRQWADDVSGSTHLRKERFSASTCHLVQSTFLIMSGGVFAALGGVSPAEQVKILLFANIPFAVQALASERDTFDMTHTISLISDITFGFIMVLWAPDDAGIIEFVRLAVLFRALFDILVNIREHIPEHPTHVVLMGVALAIASTVSGAKFLQFRHRLEETSFIMTYIVATSFLTITRTNLPPVSF